MKLSQEYPSLKLALVEKEDKLGKKRMMLMLACKQESYSSFFANTR